MATLAPKPWNSPWDRAAERDPKYKEYCYGHRLARSFSWRYLKKVSWSNRTKNGRRLQRAHMERTRG